MAQPHAARALFFLAYTFLIGGQSESSPYQNSKKINPLFLPTVSFSPYFHVLLIESLLTESCTKSRPQPD